uniref:Uncharacterized protein n=1 Tax=Arundo donax TaxID=35708 RepID=A0A0A9CJE5_ARUDO
MVALLRARV